MPPSKLKVAPSHKRLGTTALGSLMSYNRLRLNPHKTHQEPRKAG